MERLKVITGGGEVKEHVQNTIQEDFNMYDGALSAAVRGKLPMNAIDSLLDSYGETGRMAEALQMPASLMKKKARLFTRGDGQNGT